MKSSASRREHTPDCEIKRLRRISPADWLGLNLGYERGFSSRLGAAVRFAPALKPRSLLRSSRLNERVGRSVRSPRSSRLNERVGRSVRSPRPKPRSLLRSSRLKLRSPRSSRLNVRSGRLKLRVGRSARSPRLKPRSLLRSSRLKLRSPRSGRLKPREGRSPSSLRRGRCSYSGRKRLSAVKWGLYDVRFSVFAAGVRNSRLPSLSASRRGRGVRSTRSVELTR